jgi:hypothetical protein
MVGATLALPTEPPTRTEVVGIQKTHNVVWRCECAETKALRLDILFAVVGLKGEWVGATVDFYNEAGRPLLSVMEPFMNRSGQVSAWTKLIRIQEDARWLRTTVIIPYRAFPCPADRGSYRVEARVRLVKRRGVDQYQAVAKGTTTFTVHGTSNAPRDWRDYTGAGPRKLPSCQERVQRFMGRKDVLKVTSDAPARARTKWRPFCPVPGA